MNGAPTTLSSWFPNFYIGNKNSIEKGMTGHTLEIPNPFISENRSSPHSPKIEDKTPRPWERSLRGHRLEPLTITFESHQQACKNIYTEPKTIHGVLPEVSNISKATHLSHNPLPGIRTPRVIPQHWFLPAHSWPSLSLNPRLTWKKIFIMYQVTTSLLLICWGEKMSTTN